MTKINYEISFVEESESDADEISLEDLELYKEIIIFKVYRYLTIAGFVINGKINVNISIEDDDTKAV